MLENELLNTKQMCEFLYDFNKKSAKICTFLLNFVEKVVIFLQL